MDGVFDKRLNIWCTWLAFLFGWHTWCFGWRIFFYLNVVFVVLIGILGFYIDAFLYRDGELGVLAFFISFNFLTFILNTDVVEMIRFFYIF